MGPELQPERLPLSATFLVAAVHETLGPLLQVEEPRRRISPDTAVTPCAGKDLNVLFPEVHAVPAGGGWHAGILAGRPALPEPTTGTLVSPGRC